MAGPGLLTAKDSYHLVTFNALQSVTGISNTPVGVFSTQKKWYGFCLNNRDASARWLQVFFKPEASVVYGTTAPDKTIEVPAGGSVSDEFNNPFLVTGITVAAATTETGTTAPTNPITGELYFAR